MKHFVATSFLALFVLAAPVLAQQNATEKKADPQKKEQKDQPAAQESTKKAADNIKVAHVFRTSTLEGMEVRNAQNEKLGEIKELVVDLESGQVKYAALSFGGVLGIGDKLFAVPWKALTVKYGEKDKYFVLNKDKQSLKTAKGFDQDHWPDMGNPKWAAETETFYQTAEKPERTETKQR